MPVLFLWGSWVANKEGYFTGIFYNPTSIKTNIKLSPSLYYEIAQNIALLAMAVKLTQSNSHPVRLEDSLWSPPKQNLFINNLYVVMEYSAHVLMGGALLL